jgi:hypothetical protein
MMIDFIKIIQPLELEFLDKLSLLISFTNLEPDDQKILIEEIKNNPELLNQIKQSYLEKKKLIEEEDIEGYQNYLLDEEGRLKKIIEDYLREQNQSQEAIV